ncbi:HEPN domain-containing protein, partial [Candidatus Frankia nodulisporulans]|uniref:HEPN domain-containing protein n=2 Tax=Candidatus Frankia nodulisporulans TaxID=2060052 RepID=UPI0015831062
MGALNPDRKREADRWVEVARERGKDADALHEKARQLGALYLTGYVVEAYAKALGIALNGLRFRRDHRLVLLLEDCGIRRADLPHDLRVYADRRTVEMRYDPVLSPTIDYETELASAQALTQWP